MAKDKNTSGSAPASTDAAATTTATKYQTMIVGVPKSQKDTKAKLDALSVSLGCRVSDLVWAGVALILASPPKIAPAGASSSTGSSAGFWVNPVFKDNKVTTVTVTEVAKRSDAQGRTFFRFTVGDAKGRVRSMNQALRAAQYDAKIAGLDPAGIKVKELPQAKAA